jgi:hypothetical protein
LIFSVVATMDFGEAAKWPTGGVSPRERPTACWRSPSTAGETGAHAAFADEGKVALHTPDRLSSHSDFRCRHSLSELELRIGVTSDSEPDAATSWFPKTNVAHVFSVRP